MNTNATQLDARIQIGFSLVTVALLALVFARPSQAADHSSRESLQGTTIVLFADRPMTSALWMDIETALRDELSPASSEIQSLTNPNITSLHLFRGDEMPLGLEVQASISVYLHGDCNLSVRASFKVPHRISGALGWVVERNGHIQPFVHIDCALIGDLLRSRSAFLNAFYDQTQRTQIMAVAIARVLFHEYIHITTQSSAHTKHGLTKSELNADDLTAPIYQSGAELRAKDNTSRSAAEALTRPATGR